MRIHWSFLSLLLTLPLSSKGASLDQLCKSLQHHGAAKSAFQKELKDRKLDDRLIQSLKSPSEIRDALCIITETKRTQLTPSILSIAESELIPEVFSSLIRLTNTSNRLEIEKKAKTWLTQTSGASPILRVAGALEILSRLSIYPSLTELAPLFKSDIPEIRVLSYTSFLSHLDHYSKSERIKTFESAIQTDPIQVRIAAYRKYKELSIQTKGEYQNLISKCSKDESAEVREECP